MKVRADSPAHHARVLVGKLAESPVTAALDSLYEGRATKAQAALAADALKTLLKEVELPRSERAAVVKLISSARALSSRANR